MPRSLRASLGLSPPPLATPPPRGRARAHSHTHSHSQARVRTPARPEPRSLQQIPLSRAPLLTQASSRHGASSVCGSGGGGSRGNRSCSLAASCSFLPGTESGRSGEGGRRGEEKPRRAQRPAPRGGLPPLPVPRLQVSKQQLRGPQHPWSVRAWSGGSPVPPPPRPRDRGLEGSGLPGGGGE